MIIVNMYPRMKSEPHAEDNYLQRICQCILSPHNCFFEYTDNNNNMQIYRVPYKPTKGYRGAGKVSVIWSGDKNVLRCPKTIFRIA